jgi:type 1 glutamine amidotransferase
VAGRINAYLVCGGKFHDFDFARLELLKLLGEDIAIRTKVAEHYEDLDALCAADFVVTYTCDVRPSDAAQIAVRDWVAAGGRLLALHATNSAFDAPARFDQGDFQTPRAFPVFADTLGSQFLSHPEIAPYTVTVSPGAEDDPLVAGIEPFDANDELYLCEYHGEIEPLLETRWTGTTIGFATAEWPVDEARYVMYRKRIGDGATLYFTLGHCRSHWDMPDPPFNGMKWPTIDRGSWELGEFSELLRRCIAWAAAPARARLAAAAAAKAAAKASAPATAPATGSGGAS